MINAFKDGTPTEGGTPYSAEVMNALLSLQSFSLVYEGTQVDAKTGAGAYENNIANYNYAARFTLTGTTEISRVEMELDRDGEGVDLIVQIRDYTFDTILKQVVVPKEFIPNSAAYWSVPIDLTGLTANAQYWLVAVRAGDAVNKVDWIGEAVQDANYPAYYRAGDSGAWTANNALHFKVFSGESGELVHGIYGQNGHTTVEYDGEMVSKVYRYLPPADGPVGGIRDVMTYTWGGEYLKRGDV